MTLSLNVVLFQIHRMLIFDAKLGGEMKDLKSMLKRWNQTGEYRDIPPDEFVEKIREAQKGGYDMVEDALELCYERYRKDKPPVRLIKALSETPIRSDDGLWVEVVQLYLSEHKISVQQGCTLILKAASTTCLQDVFGKMMETNQAKVWGALVLAIKQAGAKDLTAILFGLRKCRDHFDAEGVRHIHELVKTREPRFLAPRVAAVLPNDLPVALQWMFLCEKQKTDVALKLLANMMFVMGEGPFGIDHWQSKLDEASKVKQKTADLVDAWLDLEHASVVSDQKRANAISLVDAWLDLYIARIHAKIHHMFWRRGNNTFKIGFIETAAEKKERDGLEAWLEDPNTKIVGKCILVHKLHTVRDWKRRKEGNVWHTKLAKLFYESGMFKSVGVERKVSDKTVDILLEDEYGKDIHIEAWDGMTEMSYNIQKSLQWGERFNINNLGRCGDEDGVFEWKHALKWLNGKIKQLPPTGRNFVIAQRPYNELVWQSMDGVDLKDNICVMQVMPPNALVGCKNNERMAITVQLISESLDCTIMWM